MGATILILDDVLQDDVGDFILQAWPDNFVLTRLEGIGIWGRDDQSALELSEELDGFGRERQC